MNRRDARRATGLLATVLLLLAAIAPGVIETARAQAPAAPVEEPDRDYWVSRYERLRADVEELRTRVEMLNTQYTKAKKRNYPRGERRAELAMDLEEARKELAEKEAEWEAFPEEARRAGAYPGWFRD